jgi:hypothetical protein
MGIMGVEIGLIQQMTIQIARANTVVGKPINIDILMASLDIAIEFKKKSESRINDAFNDNNTNKGGFKPNFKLDDFENKLKGDENGKEENTRD